MCLIFECHPSRLLFMWIQHALTSFSPGWRDGWCGSLGGQVQRNHVLRAHLSLPILSSLWPEDLLKFPRKKPPLQIMCLTTYATSNICCSFVFPRIYTLSVFMFSFLYITCTILLSTGKWDLLIRFLWLRNPPKKFYTCYERISCTCNDCVLIGGW